MPEVPTKGQPAAQIYNAWRHTQVPCCSCAAESVCEKYLEWMQRGIHIITPNKKMNSGSLQRYRNLKHHQRSSYIHYFYETTVGAGGWKGPDIVCLRSNAEPGCLAVRKHICTHALPMPTDGCGVLTRVSQGLQGMLCLFDAPLLHATCRPACDRHAAAPGRVWR